MGKKLIIKGADFSENRIPEQEVPLLSRTNDILQANTKSSLASSPFCDPLYEQLQGRVITGIEMKPAQAGTISVLRAQSLDSGGTVKIAEITIDSNDIGQTKKYEVNIPVGSTDIICIGLESDSGGYYYNSNSSGTNIFMKVGTSNYRVIQDRSMSMNWYGY